jgi:hypothetical protein
VGNQKQKTLLKNEQPIPVSEHHKPTNQSPQKSAHTQPQKSHTGQRICS